MFTLLGKVKRKRKMRADNKILPKIILITSSLLPPSPYFFPSLPPSPLFLPPKSLLLAPKLQNFFSPNIYSFINPPDVPFK